MSQNNYWLIFLSSLTLQIPFSSVAQLTKDSVWNYDKKEEVYIAELFYPCYSYNSLDVDEPYPSLFHKHSFGNPQRVEIYQPDLYYDWEKRGEAQFEQDSAGQISQKRFMYLNDPFERTETTVYHQGYRIKKNTHIKTNYVSHQMENIYIPFRNFGKDSVVYGVQHQGGSTLYSREHYIYTVSKRLIDVTTFRQESISLYPASIVSNQRFWYDDEGRLIRVHREDTDGFYSRRETSFEYNSTIDTEPNTISQTFPGGSYTLSNCVFFAPDEETTEYLRIENKNIRYAEMANPNVHERVIRSTFGNLNPWVTIPTKPRQTFQAIGDTLDFATGYFNGRVYNERGHIIQEYKIGKHPFYGRDTIQSTKIVYTWNADNTLFEKAFYHKGLNDLLSWESSYKPYIKLRFSEYHSPLITGTQKKTNVGSAFKETVIVYPNPTKGILNFKIPQHLEEVPVEIYTLQGALLKKEVVKEGTLWKLENVSPGLYLLRASYSTHSQTTILAIE